MCVFLLFGPSALTYFYMLEHVIGEVMNQNLQQVFDSACEQGRMFAEHTHTQHIHVTHFFRALTFLAMDDLKLISDPR